MIKFKYMTKSDLKIWHEWVDLPHVKDTWFIQGYEPPEYIQKKIDGNGYDYPFIIYINDLPVGYIQCCDLYAYSQLCHNKKGLFLDEPFGTFCFDLFIADSNYLDQGYGTKIVKQFCALIFEIFYAERIMVDPAANNYRAIRCYEKSGFSKIEVKNDGVTDSLVMMLTGKKKLSGKLFKSFIHRIAKWGYEQNDIFSIAVVGSYARGDASTQSDVDLIVFCEDKTLYLENISWVAMFGNPISIHKEEYGKVNSLRVFYKQFLEVEYGFTSLEWASMPLDPGTKKIIDDGIKVVIDKLGSLTKLLSAIRLVLINS